VIVLKMKRLFSRSPEYLLQDDFLDDFPEFSRYLCDAGRADLVRKVLDRTAQNFQSEEQPLRLSTVQALVRMHQTFIDLSRGDLLGEGYLLLAKQIKAEPEMVVFARILAAIVADYQKVLELRDLGIANNILRLLMRLRDEATGAAQKQIFEQAVAKLTSPDNLTDALFESVQSEDERESEAAARLLAAFAPEPVVLRLLEILAKSEDRRIRKKCVTLVTRYGDMARGVVVRRFAPDNPWYFNRNLINILADIGDASSVAPVLVFLRHSDDRLRKAAIAALTRIGGPAAAQALADCFDEQSPEIQTTLIQYFSKEKTAAAVSLFIAKLQDKDILEGNEPLAIQMIHALGDIGDNTAREVLQGFLKRASGLKSMFSKQSEALLAAAISALGRLGDNASADGIKKFAHHSNADVARAAQQSLRMLQGGQI
jgi:HEAT repeat protein